MKRFTYKILEDQEVLVYEEQYNAQGQVLYYKDYQANPPAEKKICYNESGLLVEEIDISDNVELNRLEQIYNDNGENIERNFFFGEHLYEKITTEFSEMGFTKTTYQDGEEIQKLIQENDDKNYANKFYQNGELLESQFAKYNSETNCSEIKFYDGKNKHVLTRKETYNNLNLLVRVEELNENNNLLSEHQYEIEKGLITKEIYRDFRSGENEYHITMEYDNKENLIKKDIRTPSGHLVEFYICEYDGQNRMIDEKGMANGSFNAIYGTYANGEEYHFIHRYEE